MKAEFVNPFVTSAFEVLQHELHVQPTRGQLSASDSRLVGDDVNVIVSVTGDVRGVAIYSLTEKTAKAFCGAMTGETVPVYDEMVQSAIAEMGNVITGRAAAMLDKAGYRCDISPPSVITGRGMMISTLGLPHLVLPVHTPLGDVLVRVALEERR